jgi:4-hydroxy-3-methylbut-2-enyl diphosphate reductase
MKIIRAQHLGMCFGVRDAISLAQQQAQKQPLTVLGELVHNQFVLQDLRQRGVQIAKNANAATTPHVMITAHGASEKSKNNARALGLQVIDATCPLVASAHMALQRLVAKGLHPVIIGIRNHVEVRGMTEDLAEFDVILSVEDVEKLDRRTGYGIVAQTTQPIQRVRLLIQELRNRFPDSVVEFTDTVCRPTKQRQQAAIDLAQNSTVVIVVGGANSNNTRELVATCAEHCPNVFHVQDDTEVHSEWFEPESIVGITAGTSTPDLLIDAVEGRVREIQKSLEALQIA